MTPDSVEPGGLIVRRLRQIPKLDATRLFEWGQDLWSIDCYQLSWRQWDWGFVGYLNDAPVSHVGTLTHTVSVAGEEVLIGGLAAVLTLPEVRGQGHGSTTLETAVRFLRESEQVSFVLLFCRDQLFPFYEPRGWRRIEDVVTIQQPDRDRPSPLNTVVRSLDGSAWPSGPVNLNSYPW